MIVFTQRGYLEFNAVPGRPGHFAVGAWVDGDIERCFPGAEVEAIDPDIGEARWRQFKAIVRKEQVFDLLASEAADIDYDTVYRQVPSSRHRMMMEDWQSNWAEDSYQRWLRKSK